MVAVQNKRNVVHDITFDAAASSIGQDTKPAAQEAIKSTYEGATAMVRLIQTGGWALELRRPKQTLKKGLQNIAQAKDVFSGVVHQLYNKPI